MAGAAIVCGPAARVGSSSLRRQWCVHYEWVPLSSGDLKMRTASFGSLCHCSITPRHTTPHHTPSHHTSHHVAHHITPHYTTSHSITSHHITSHIISYHNTPYHSTSHPITPHITSRRISHHTTLHHVTQHHITSRRTSYHTTSHHIISYFLCPFCLYLSFLLCSYCSSSFLARARILQFLVTSIQPGTDRSTSQGSARILLGHQPVGLCHRRCVVHSLHTFDLRPTAPCLRATADGCYGCCGCSDVRNAQLQIHGVSVVTVVSMTGSTVPKYFSICSWPSPA
jgi:hypothetical protein